MAQQKCGTMTSTIYRAETAMTILVMVASWWEEYHEEEYSEQNSSVPSVSSTSDDSDNGDEGSETYADSGSQGNRERTVEEDDINSEPGYYDSSSE
ncbi:hypothetical protein COL26b_001993 [Colletotrichum chrysophilum]|uniref:uncharacterized protein n=1 Tax=Colletotrichum chrysophilum TaxID=1836956 RepID=UPI002301BC93|nr:uncharacterized protein COL26b_001993 [Colletotrichum chrysophilum]KAJ0379840.1 hypothetical protein COL26b_001993 [Colletotrichum chrysophilum]